MTPQLYQMRSDTLSEFFRGILTQIIGLCRLGHSGFISTIDGLLLTQEGEQVCLQAGVGEFDDPEHKQERIQEVIEMCSSSVRDLSLPSGLRSDAMIAPLRLGGRLLGYVYLESASKLSDSEREMILIMADQCAAALENLTGAFQSGRKNGTPLLMIGHPYPETVQAFREEWDALRMDE